MPSASRAARVKFSRNPWGARFQKWARESARVGGERGASRERARAEAGRARAGGILVCTGRGEGSYAAARARRPSAARGPPFGCATPTHVGRPQRPRGAASRPLSAARTCSVSVGTPASSAGSASGIGKGPDRPIEYDILLKGTRAQRRSGQACHPLPAGDSCSSLRSRGYAKGLAHASAPRCESPSAVHQGSASLARRAHNVSG